MTTMVSDTCSEVARSSKFVVPQSDAVRRISGKIKDGQSERKHGDKKSRSRTSSLRLPLGECFHDTFLGMCVRSTDTRRLSDNGVSLCEGAH